MKQHIQLPSVDEVKLPSFFGMRPGVYILVLLVVALLVCIFLLGFLPGILKGGRYVNFKSDLAESGIEVDGKYVGGTPYLFFVKSGKHEVVVHKGGVEVSRYALDVDHPLFLTNLFRRTMDSHPPLTDLAFAQKQTINTFNLNEIIRYSAVTTFNEVTTYPPVFMNLVSDGKALKLDEQLFSSSVELALNYITSKEMLDDAIQALELYPYGTTPLMTKTLELAKQLFDSQSMSNIGMNGTNQVAMPKATTLAFGEFKQPGFSYPSQTIVMGKQVMGVYPETNQGGVSLQVPAFSIASLPVSQYQWAQFIQENPRWEKGNLEELRSANLVDQYYLSGLTPVLAFASARPIYNISYQAALAFCDWLSKKSGKKVFLPTEAMWTVSALSAQDKSYEKSLTATHDASTSPSMLLGGVWEFTQSSYIPLARITDYEYLQGLVRTLSTDVQPIVKGGGYMNNAASITLDTVGVVDSKACADQIGFRIAWYE